MYREMSIHVLILKEHARNHTPPNPQHHKGGIFLILLFWDRAGNSSEHLVINASKKSSKLKSLRATATPKTKMEVDLLADLHRPLARN